MNGTVIWWSVERGWGFAYGEDRHKYFLNRRELQDIDNLRSGDVLEFEPCRNFLGRSAVAIRLTQKTATDYDFYWSPTRDGGHG